MSTASREHNSLADILDGGDDDMATPRSEMPLVVRSGTRAADGPVATDYFPPGILPERAGSSASGPTVTAAPIHISPAAHGVAASSNVHVPGHILSPDAVLSSIERPPPYSRPSDTSIDSTTTSVTVLPMYAPRPIFPNQSYAALHHQQHPLPHLPPLLRQRSSHPGQIFTFASALASSHQAGARTAGNSPAVTPGVGLFSPSSQPVPHRDDPDSPGTYASPFLHFTHRQPPKETHVADVDVDPISGRKLINHYEIIDELGRGTHGKVKLGRDLQTENTHVAIKIVERYSKRRKLGKLGKAEDKVKKEVAILKKARHPNVVALLEVIDDPSRKKVYIVLEWVARGEIHWRTKTRKEIAMVEARRYERERGGKMNRATEAEDAAVLSLAKERLAKSRRHEIRKYRQDRRDARDLPEHMWSAELIGDNESDQTDDDYLSRVSTTTTDSIVEHRVAQESRLPSRGPSPFHALGERDQGKAGTSPALDTSDTGHFLPLTAEPEQQSDTLYEKEHTMFQRTGLEGTMYGAYDPSSANPSRYSSLDNSIQSLTGEHAFTPEALAQLASEVLDSDLNPELEYVPVMSLQQARVAFRDTLLGLQYLHYQGIVHRDIKPPNLLSTIDHRVKISDFGVSYLGRPLNEGEAGEEVSEHEAQDFDEAKELAKTVGTPAFYAPELCITDPGDDPLPVTKAIDVWALGMTLFCMLFARTPYVDNEFIVMRQIADEDVYIPRKRLQPVQLQSASQARPSSHGRVFPALPRERRSEFDFAYEDIDDELYDLLRRLLTKDPRQRITLEEVRHHPWVLSDLSNKLKWLEDTDASRQSQGKKIEVSKEDVNTAVVPLQFLDRVRSGIKKVSERLGLSSKTSTGRGRAQSTAGTSTGGSPTPSAHPSSSTISQDARRQSLRGDESIFAALQKSREGEHLSKIEVPAFELQRGKSYEDVVTTVPERVDEERYNVLHPTLSRPSPPLRSHTIMSTTGSGRTLKASDFRGRSESPPLSPGLPGTPIAYDSPGGHGLSTALGSSPARRVLKSLRERSSHGRLQNKAQPTSRAADSPDRHTEASVAVSQAMASGQVNPPDAFKDLPPLVSASSSVQPSPAPSAPHSLVSSPTGHSVPLTIESGVRSASISRHGSVSSLRSVSRCTVDSTKPGSISRPVSRMSPESSVEEYDRAEQILIRRFLHEREMVEKDAPKQLEEIACPPSPDDDPPARSASGTAANLLVSHPESSHETSPTSHGTFLPPAMLSSTSDLGSAVSMSISNPSIPSAISEASSTDLPDGRSTSQQHEDDKGNTSSEGTINLPSGLESEKEMDEGYSPDIDRPFSSDNDEEYVSSSDDSDGGLVMQRQKPIATAIAKATTAAKVDDSDIVRTNERRRSGLVARSRKSSRSGSSNTMKKVRTRDSAGRQSLDASED